ncbi:MAG TPA: Uma2 family endonuclease [Rhodothermales bacterium]|nr:Uma2 family endonuclease [Rhodothermales bacterium]
MQPKLRTFTVEEYLALDEAAPQGVRLEYGDGLIYLNGQPYDPEWGWDVALDMAGASPKHNDIASNLHFSLRSRLGDQCRISIADMAVSVGKGKYSYPDLTVTCGDRVFNDAKPAALINPTVVIEIVSPSSKARDFGDKLDLYIQIPSLLEYWIVEQEIPRILRYVRTGGIWVVHSERGSYVASEHLSVEISLNEIYPAE